MTLDVYRGRKTTKQQQQVIADKHDKVILIADTYIHLWPITPTLRIAYGCMSDL